MTILFGAARIKSQALVHRPKKRSISTYPYPIGPLSRFDPRTRTNVRRGSKPWNFAIPTAISSLPQVVQSYFDVMRSDNKTHPIRDLLLRIKGMPALKKANSAGSGKRVRITTQKVNVIPPVSYSSSPISERLAIAFKKADRSQRFDFLNKLEKLMTLTLS